jgi:histidyl-tRNA synthetase
MPFSAPKGTYDVRPPDSARWLEVRGALLVPARLAGYALIDTPIFEDTALFARGVGESTDVVSKEMFTFTDKGGRSLTLRPEGTAGVVRAVVEHGLHHGQLPVKVWYAGPMFRHERPQAGRFRQFQQVGIEALGVDDPALDAEVVALAVEAFRELGLQRTELLLTTLGDRVCRPVYTEQLREFLAGLPLDADTRRRAEVNPLRVLDDKRPEVQALVADAPALVEHLCEECRVHYDLVRAHLTDLGISWHEAPRLVRGLDYYMRTTFELQHPLLGAQSAVGGGGRYDGLSEAIGGPPLPGIGWALGVERTLLALDAEGVHGEPPARCAVFAVPLSEDARRFTVPLIDELRRAGIPTDMAYGGRGLKGAMKAADRSGAALAVVIGAEELATRVVQLKDLSTGEQQAVSADDVVAQVRKRLP